VRPLAISSPDFEVDTIVAIATPPGRGGLGVVRLSGPRATSVLAPILRMAGELTPRRACLAAVLDRTSGAMLDQAVVTWFAAPRSYTGDDVLEVSVHGAPVLLDYLVRTAAENGARLAEPGEFTQRAFLAGRLDLTQAEAVHDLIAASTLQQARVAAAQLGGAVSRAVAPVKDSLLNLIASLEAGIDFAEDDVDLLPPAQIMEAIDALLTPLQALERSFTYGRAVRDGVTLAIVGRPNAGKSTLFNALLGRQRAIVTAQPGTTRDLVEDRTEIAGIPVSLVDTAGLRQAPAGPEGEAEALGIERSRETLADAGFVLLVIDASAGTHAEDAAVLASLRDRPHLVVWNKSDLVPALPEPVPAGVRVSAATGTGMASLRRSLAEALVPSGADAASAEPALLTNLRQHQAVAEALAALAKARLAAGQEIPHEFLLLDLASALASLDALTGSTAPDEVLHRIFASFCIGK
jgi:tRNA modification GTPase